MADKDKDKQAPNGAPTPPAANKAPIKTGDVVNFVHPETNANHKAHVTDVYEDRGTVDVSIDRREEAACAGYKFRDVKESDKPKANHWNRIP